MTRSSVILCVITLLATTTPVVADGPIDIGGVSASIGAAQQPLLESLRKQYDVEELRSNTFVVYKDDPSKNTVGVVQFQDGKLVWASRDVGAFEGEAVRMFAQTLFQLLAAHSPEDRTPIRITTSVSTSQPLAFGSVTLEFPGRRVVVDVGYDDELVDASIEEIIYVDTTGKSAMPAVETRDDTSLSTVPSPGTAAYADASIQPGVR